MKPYQHEFIELSIKLGALRFGEFTLKSGRKSPYFFNIGTFNTGQTLAKLGSFYASMIRDNDFNFDILFGPAYKGIPLAVSTAIAFAEYFHQDVPYAFNRKESKDHGEGGRIVGRDLQGRILIIDDVITAGTAILESIEIIKNNHATLCGVVLALDRQEQSASGSPTIELIQQKYHMPVVSIIR